MNNEHKKIETLYEIKNFIFVTIIVAVLYKEKIMFAKSIFFTSLLVGSFFIFVNAKESDAFDPDPTQDSDFDYSNSENPKDRPVSFRVPTKSERNELVRTFLSSYEKSAAQDLIENIVEVTDGYTISQLTDILIDIMNTSEKDELEQLICIRKLEEAVNRIDTDQMKQLKLARLEKIIHKSTKPLPFSFDWTLKGDAKSYGFDTVFPRADERLKITELSFNSDWLKKDLEPTHDLSTVFPTDDERLKIVKKILLEHKEFASEFFMQKVVEQTSGFDESYCKNWVTDIVEILESSDFKQDSYLECSTPNERREVVEEILLLTDKSVPEDLIENIIELTKYCDISTVRKLMSSMVRESKTRFLDRNSCIEKLKKAINSLDCKAGNKI